MQQLRSGSSVTYSETTWIELRECSESRTLLDLDWAFEADHDDTDHELDPWPEDFEHDGADSAVANISLGEADPAVADPTKYTYSRGRSD